MADGGIGNQSPATIFQARLVTTNGVSNTLTLGQYIGNKVVVSGLTVPIPLAGLTRDIADNLIDANGGDAGAPPAASTLYYVYVSNQKATFSPSSIRLSASIPVLVNGVRYLGAAGNALNWRFVGWVQTNATPQFESTDQNRLIVNYYNRLRLRLYTPASGNFTTASTVFVEADPTGSLRVSFIANGEDSMRLSGLPDISADGITIWEFGMAIDNTTVPDPFASGGRGGAGVLYATPAQKELSLSEGFHFATMVWLDSNAANLTMSAVDVFGGTGAAASYVEGGIQG